MTCQSNCCGGGGIDSKQKNTFSWFGRALLMLGVIASIPAVENIVAVGITGYSFFALGSFFIFGTIFQNFTKSLYFAFGITLALGVTLFVPLFATTILTNTLIAMAISFAIFLLFISNDFWQDITLWLEGKNIASNSSEERKNYFVLPSIDKVILLLSLLNWQLTLGHLLLPAVAIYPYVLQDALLVLGIFNIQVAQRRSATTSYNSSSGDIEVSRIHQNTENGVINISAVKKDMTISPKSDTGVILSIRTKSVNQCKIQDPASEQQLTIEGETEVEAGSLLISGEFFCLEDYSEPAAVEQDIRLSILLLATLSIALTFGVWHGILVSSFISGIQVFCLNLIACCPCVFLVTKPIIYQKFSAWLKDTNLSNSVICKSLPSCGKPKFMVFDRTNTLYLPDVANPNTPYKISESNKKLLTDLKNTGITCYILSGHASGNNWKDHLRECKNELEGIIDADKIIFDEKYHGDKSSKDKVIANLQKYGKTEEPNSRHCWGWLRWRLFGGYKVAMVGDGSNDISAMKQADLAISVYEKQNSGANSYNAVSAAANLCLNRDKLTNLTSVMNKLEGINCYNETFIGIALLYNMTMLAMVNGLSMFLFGFILPPSAVCLLSSIFCVLLPLAIHQFVSLGDQRAPDFAGGNNSCTSCSIDCSCSPSTLSYLKPKDPQAIQVWGGASCCIS